jgi:excisionase family DNA binding protein
VHAIQRQLGEVKMATVDRTRANATTATQSQLWTAHDVADFLGVSHEYVWQLSREGRIPTVSLGRSRRYRQESILAWLEQIESQGGRV